MTLKTSFNRVFSCLCSCTLFFFICLFSFVPSVSALDLPSSGSNALDWAISSGIQEALVPIEKAVLYRFSSDSAEVDTALAIMNAELGFCYALSQDAWAAQQGFENFSTTGTSFYVLSGVSNVQLSDGSSEMFTSTLTLSTNSVCGRSGNGVYFLWRPSVGYTPLLLISNGYAVFKVGNKNQSFTLYSSYFDTQSPLETGSGSALLNCQVFWSNSTIPSLTPSYYSSSSRIMNNFLRTTQTAPLPVDTSSDDVPSIMAAYKSALASQLGITVEDVDEVWTLPDEIPEEPTEPDGTGCCCEPFELPSEWVQSDVVELETDHYTIPYTDLVRNPYDYLLYGVTAPPPPVTPADDAKKVLQTKTTSTQATRSGDPINDLQNTDPEMYQALLDYSQLIKDVLDRSGVLPYWAILMAAGALFLII